MARLLRSWPTWVILAGSLLAGCQPTPYQRLGKSSAGGYSHEPLSADTFFVRFVANTHTSPDTVRSYLYRHAAELTLKYGYCWFVVMRGPSAITSRMDLTPYEDHINYHGPQVRPPSVLEVDVPNPRRQKMVIQCFVLEPERTDALCIEARTFLE
jgi:hypothetical protein